MWVVHKETQVSFFYDTWIPHFPYLRQCVQGPLNEDEHSMIVTNLRRNHEWILDILSVTFSVEVQRIIKNTTIYVNAFTKDKKVWRLTPNGMSTTSSAYTHIVGKANPLKKSLGAKASNIFGLPRSLTK